jgi:glycosyltransferase involved in cell wall biosynthesis
VQQPDNPSASNSIDISVVIPARNEEDSIGVLLGDLLNQTLRPNEIVITDGGSTDATREVINEFMDAGAPVKLICDPNSMPGRARNLAAHAANGEWLAFTDAGIRLSPDWLQALASAAKATSADVVYGTYEPVKDTFFTECAAIAYVPPPFQTDDGLVRPRSIVSALMRRVAWQTAGGFPEHLRSAEDLLFMNRVEEAGFRIARTGRAKAFWSIQPNLWLTFKRFVEYSRNNIRAGLFDEWQRTIFFYYALIVLSAGAVIFLGLTGLIVPGLFWLLLMMARAAKALYRNHQSSPASLPRNFARLFFVALIIAVLDAAAFAGSIKWLAQDNLGLIGSEGRG